MNTSHSLLSRAKAHNPAAKEDLYLIYQPMIASWLRREGVSEHDVNDLAHDTLLKAFESLPGYEHNGRLGAFRCWLRTIMARHLQRERYRHNHRPQAQGGSDFLARLDQLADSNSAAAREWDEEHDRYVTRRLLAVVKSDFPKETFEMFSDWVFHDVSPDELAAKHHVTVGAVYARKSRVLARLREVASELL